MPEPLSNEELKWGYWYFLHRAVIRRIGVTILGAVGVGLILYSGWQWVDWLASRKAEEESFRLLVTSNVNFAEYRKRNAPLPLEVGKAVAIPAGTGRYNLVALVKNPNPGWGAPEFGAVFSVDGVEVRGQGFIMPLEEKYVIHLAAQLAQPPRQVQLTIEQAGWQRVRADSNLRLPDFIVEGEKLELAEGIGTSLRFTLFNRSTYGYYDVGVTAVLLRGGVPVAVGRQLIASITSGERRVVELAWPQALVADRLIVKPEVNVFDAAVVRPL